MAFTKSRARIYAEKETGVTFADVAGQEEAKEELQEIIDFLRDPEGHLRWLCDYAGVDFTPAMVAWPSGPRDSDGVWAPYWYDSVKASTGFAPYRPPAATLPARLEPLAAQCQPYFDRLHRYRITGESWHASDV